MGKNIFTINRKKEKSCYLQSNAPVINIIGEGVIGVIKCGCIA